MESEENKNEFIKTNEILNEKVNEDENIQLNVDTEI